MRAFDSRVRQLLTAFLLSLSTASIAPARELADIFQQELAGLELEPAGAALAGAVAGTYPVASASSSVTYVFNPTTESFERRTRVLGPILGERAETIGSGRLDINVSYSYVHISEINGRSLDDLVSLPSIDGRVISFPVSGGVTLADGRFSSFLPVMVRADLDVTAHITSPSLTYGVTPDLDVNLTLPILVTSLDVDVVSTVPDPRLPQFALNPGNINAQQRRISTSDRSASVGDLLLRGKYVMLRDSMVDVAAGLAVSFPSGNPDDFHGSGDYRVEPSLILSRVLGGRFEPLLNLGMVFNADDVDRSVFRWGIGSTGVIAGGLNGALVFFGRHELGQQSDSISAPFFFQIERNDIYDASIGLRYLIGESSVISANVIVPLNEEGLRADVIPTLAAEYTF